MLGGKGLFGAYLSMAPHFAGPMKALKLNVSLQASIINLIMKRDVLMMELYLMNRDIFMIKL